MKKENYSWVSSPEQEMEFSAGRKPEFSTRKSYTYDPFYTISHQQIRLEMIIWNVPLRATKGSFCATFTTLLSLQSLVLLLAAENVKLPSSYGFSAKRRLAAILHYWQRINRDYVASTAYKFLPHVVVLVAKRRKKGRGILLNNDDVRHYFFRFRCKKRQRIMIKELSCPKNVHSARDLFLRPFHSLLHFQDNGALFTQIHL